MIDFGYPYSEAFQRRFLALLVQDPGAVSSIFEPSYFGCPICAHIAGIVMKTHKKYPDAKLTLVSLKELVKSSLSRKARHNWSLYKKEIKYAFIDRLSDKPVLIERAATFAKEARYREALVRAEINISAGRYDLVDKEIEKARRSGLDQNLGPTAAELPVFNLHRLLATDFERSQDYLVETIVPRGGAIVAYGLPKGLKSWASTAVALDAEIGGKALGYFGVPRPVRVLLVQIEDPAGRTKVRLQRLKEARLFRKNPYPGNLKIITRCPLNLTDRHWVSQLEAVIAKQKTELIIFDVFRRLFRGDVNSAQDTAGFLEQVDALRDKYHLAAWLVHHSNKKSEGEMMTKALGSINLTAWADVLLYFKHKKEWKGITTCTLEIETKDEAIENELKVILDDEGEPLFRVEKAKPAEDKLQRAISNLKNKWTVDELAEVLDLKYAGAYKVLREWQKEGIAASDSAIACCPLYGRVPRNAPR